MVTKMREIVNELHTHTHKQCGSINIVKEKNRDKSVRYNIS